MQAKIKLRRSETETATNVLRRQRTSATATKNNARRHAALVASDGGLRLLAALATKAIELGHNKTDLARLLDVAPATMYAAFSAGIRHQGAMRRRPFLARVAEYLGVPVAEAFALAGVVEARDCFRPADMRPTPGWGADPDLAGFSPSARDLRGVSKDGRDKLAKLYAASFAARFVE